jgi:hypothetical protein
METTSNQSSKDGAKTAEKTLNDTTKELMDFYTKQLNVATGFYKNIFDSLSTGGKSWNNSSDFSTGFFNNDVTKAFTNPFSGMNYQVANPFLPLFDKFYKQMEEYNKDMLASLTNGLKGNTDWSEMTKKYQETVSSRMESSKNILQTATEAYNKQLDFSNNNNKKAMEDMTSQFNAMVKQSQTFWLDLMASLQTKINTDEKTVKDSISPEIKKRASSLANELTDHKI